MFEYLGSRKPILACIPDGVAKSSLRHYNSVKICEPDNPEAISALILEYYDLYTANRLPDPNEEMVLSYEVKNLTHQLVRYFEFLIDISPQSVFQEKKIITSTF
jgi:hypothetical protein